MFILRMEHPVTDFDAWKVLFDNDPLGRERSAVRRHRIYRPVEDLSTVMIDLEFDTAKDAASMLIALRGLWRNVQGIHEPQVRIMEIVETKDYVMQPTH